MKDQIRNEVMKVLNQESDVESVVNNIILLVKNEKMEKCNHCDEIVTMINDDFCPKCLSSQ